MTRLMVAGALAALAGLGHPAPARGDGSVAVRSVYYKERATRVIQPMLDAMFDAGAHGVVTAHFLVDAITSASASSGASSGSSFTERRYEGGGGYAHQIGPLTVGVEGKYSTESDYKSSFVGGHAQLELFQKNTVLGAGGGASFDTVSAAAAQGLSATPTLRCSREQPTQTSCPLDVYSMYASVSQIISPNAVLGASADLGLLNGFQSNPYRQAIVGDGLVTERHPMQRTREAIAASARYYIAPTGTTVIAAYRYYRDNWQVHAHTPELRLVQEAGNDADVAVRYRYYTQDGAYFYRTHYPADDAAMTQYVSDDVKLSTFTGHTLEAKLGVLGHAFDLGGRWANARFEGILEYSIQNNPFGNAVVAHVAITFPFEY
jgi:hypothetical protein